MLHYLKEGLQNTPRETLGFFPTPLHKLEKLSNELGINFYIKRDDFSGISLFGGNKIRKLEYLIGDAKTKGCDTIITFGATQSNHVMETVTASRKCGLTPIVYLVDLVGTEKEDVRANLLLDTIFGAEIHMVSINDYASEADAFSALQKQAAIRSRELAIKGHQCYTIPVGGASPIGTVGYISGYVELMGQCSKMGLTPDYLMTSTGSGGTLAGLVAGKIMSGDRLNIIGITAEDKPPTYEQHIVDLAKAALSEIGIVYEPTLNDFSVSRDYYHPGYEMPSEGANHAIKKLARTEGILTDPVYSGKCLYGTLDYVQTGRIATGSTVVFLHTGGTTALFAESKIIGSLASL